MVESYLWYKNYHSNVYKFFFNNSFEVIVTKNVGRIENCLSCVYIVRKYPNIYFSYTYILFLCESWSFNIYLRLYLQASYLHLHSIRTYIDMFQFWWNSAGRIIEKIFFRIFDKYIVYLLQENAYKLTIYTH